MNYAPNKLVALEIADSTATKYDFIRYDVIEHYQLSIVVYRKKDMLVFVSMNETNWHGKQNCIAFGIGRGPFSADYRDKAVETASEFLGAGYHKSLGRFKLQFSYFLKS